MSDITNAQQKLAEFSQQASGTAQALGSFKPKFKDSIGRISQTAGGSRQNIDKDTIEMIQAAEKKVDEAIQALHSAARAVSAYANQL